jgi:hypothetical protein
MVHNFPGLYISIDGADCCGKKVIIDAMCNEAVKNSMKIFDVTDWWITHDTHPHNPLPNADIVIVSEPTFINTGKIIRNEV